MADNEDNKHTFKAAVAGLCEAAEQLVDAVSDVTSKFSSTDGVKTTDAVGKIGEVTVPIPAGGMGEIVVSLGRGMHNYSAKNVKQNQPIKRGEQVRIEKVVNQQMFVSRVED